ncbi:hypothetical protein VV869_14860 [Photobacterium sp. MCCC 1A19761]|uniref:hypothetical protein n=1 Tax=Photobacterium sp. MCCC 1A19761 TaxID=3115000 RepID=UPI00307D2088
MNSNKTSRSEVTQRSREHMVSLMAIGKGSMGSRAGYSFNIYSDDWVCGLRKDQDWINVEFLHQVDDLEHQMHLRQALGKCATTYANVASYHKVLSTLVGPQHSAVTEQAISKYLAKYRDCSYSPFTRLKAFLKKLRAVDPVRYSKLFDFAQNNRPKLVQNNLVLNPYKGALSEYELKSISTALDKRARQLFTDSNDFIDWRNFVVQRLIQMLFRRPENLYQIKWSDVRLPGSNAWQQGLASERPQIQCFYAKTAGRRFRSHPEHVLLELREASARELRRYAEVYMDHLRDHLEQRGISASADQWKALFPHLPLFPSPLLFTAEFSNFAQVLEGARGEGFHDNDVILYATSKNGLSKLKIDSDRINPDKFSWGSNRQRHTAATHLAARGESTAVLAQSIGHTTTVPVRRYVDIDLTTIRHINQTMGEHIDPLVRAYKGELIDELDVDAEVIDDVGAGGFTELGSCKRCSECSSEKPYACYPCHTFHPLRGADHRSVFERACRDYWLRRRRGVAEYSLQALMLCIKYMAVTIAACQGGNPMDLLEDIMTEEAEA